MRSGATMLGAMRKHLGMSRRGNTSDYVPYFITGATLIAASVFISNTLSESPGGGAAPWFVNPILVSLIVPILLVPAASRRVHDLGFPSFVVILPFCLPAGLMLGPPVWASIKELFGGDPMPPQYGDAFLNFLGAMAMQAVNVVIALVLCFKPSQPGANLYGPNPNEVSS